MNGYKVVVTKSTVPVGTGQLIEKVIKERTSGQHAFSVVSNPEFLREGSAIADFMRPDRVVIGARDPQAVAIMKDIYAPLNLIEVPFVVTNVESSEMIKYASNAFLATKITFINEVAELCERVGADVHHVAKGMGLDKRINPKFLHPGPGYGGSCFPKDTKAITEIARQAGRPFDLVETVVAVNERIKLRMVDKIRLACGGSTKGLTIGVLGLAFKPETDDMREAPAIPILAALAEEGAAIRAYDPAAMANCPEVLPASVVYCKDEYDAASGVDCLVIMTEWNQFRSLDLKQLHAAMRRPLVVDLRNVYEPEKMHEAGFEHHCVGRPAGAHPLR
jgi:UDPglucose 6-dehydrogenase